MNLRICGSYGGYFFFLDHSEHNAQYIYENKIKIISASYDVICALRVGCNGLDIAIFIIGLF